VGEQFGRDRAAFVAQIIDGVGQEPLKPFEHG
jgi:hypothetical protein